MCRIDHITVTAPTLERGAEFVFSSLGIRPQPGGTHPRMGTHNLLLRLGENVFLEVIAIDPHAPRPTRPRWFALDERPVDAEPCLAMWVARTDDIETASAAIPEDLGAIETMTRGALQWTITIPADGSLPFGGIGPALIEWDTSVHPAAGMQDQGCRLRRLEIFHPEPERVARLLGQMGLPENIDALALPVGARPYLVAEIDTPSGRRSIGAPPAPGLQGPGSLHRGR